jgi:vesicle transport protein SEC22
LLIADISYSIEGNVVYLTLCDKTYPKRLAFSYLEEVQKEFQEQYAREIDTAARPYAFVKFGVRFDCDDG